jgi:hypothetical protein
MSSAHEKSAVDAVPTVLAADSWLVVNGTVLALELHHERFLRAVSAAMSDDCALYPALQPDRRPELLAEAEDFWQTTIAEIPREGEWFPRVQLQVALGVVGFASLMRRSPDRSKSAIVASHRGPDPRTVPTRKGPDLAAMLEVRRVVNELGADEAIILSPEGYVVEGAYSALVWWRGSILCTPPEELERVDSVSAKALLALAAALGTPVHAEAVTPSELEGTEMWTLSALHGPRIITAWRNGPELAELPGRLSLWRSRLDALRRPIATAATGSQ